MMEPAARLVRVTLAALALGTAACPAEEAQAPRFPPATGCAVCPPETVCHEDLDTPAVVSCVPTDPDGLVAADVSCDGCDTGEPDGSDGSDGSDPGGG